MKHDPGDPIGCQCEACKFMFAEADEFAAEIIKAMPRCTRIGCTHNNCPLDRDGMCVGLCPCASPPERE